MRSLAVKIAAILLVSVVLIVLYQAILPVQNAVPNSPDGGSGDGEEGGENYTSGDFAFHIRVDNLTRSFFVHVPENLSSSPALLIALHGGGGSGRDMVKLTMGEFNTLSEKYGFLVMYPDAYDHHWNDGRNISEYASQRENVDDVKFITALIDWSRERYGIDESRVFITGMSNGALMSFRLAFEIPERIAAIATVAGSIPLNLYRNEVPRGRVPVLMINGVDDPLVPWEGGYIHFGRKKLGKVIGVEESARFWAGVDNLSLVVEKEYLPDLDPRDGTRVWKRVYGNESSGLAVILYGIDGGGHTWPSGYHYLPTWIIGRTSEDIDACAVIWKFFESY